MLNHVYFTLRPSSVTSHLSLARTKTHSFIVLVVFPSKPLSLSHLGDSNDAPYHLQFPLHELHLTQPMLQMSYWFMAEMCNPTPSQLTCVLIALAFIVSSPLIIGQSRNSRLKSCFDFWLLGAKVKRYATYRYLASNRLMLFVTFLFVDERLYTYDRLLSQMFYL